MGCPKLDLLENQASTTDLKTVWNRTCIERSRNKGLTSKNTPKKAQNDLELIHTPEGYMEPQGKDDFRYVYHIVDQVNNVRVSFTKNEETDELDVLETKDFYPFGLEQQKPGTVIGSTNLGQKFKYNGKELNDELGLDWYDYGARNYNPELGRWMNVDMKAEAYYPITPYQYVLNNPVVHQDHNGQWTVTRHYNMTYSALSDAGIGKAQADLIAHYSAVYADNPGTHIRLNNLVHPKNQQYYRDNIDYSGTAKSQVTEWNGKGSNYNIWHSMRSSWEKENSTISAFGAMERGMRFGWNKIFESAKSGSLNDLKANSSGIQALGQGLHALQDAYAHKGRHDVGASHIWNDRYGDTSQAEEITQSAITVHNLLTGNHKALNGSKEVKFNATGMTSDQFSQVLKAIQDYLNQDDEKE